MLSLASLGHTARGFIRGRAVTKLTGCENNFAHRFDHLELQVLKQDNICNNINNCRDHDSDKQSGWRGNRTLDFTM